MFEKADKEDRADEEEEYLVEQIRQRMTEILGKTQGIQRGGGPNKNKNKKS